MAAWLQLHIKGYFMAKSSSAANVSFNGKLHFSCAVIVLNGLGLIQNIIIIIINITM